MSETPQISSRIGAILRATSGNFLEQFDFFLFGFYASYISKAFFPTGVEATELMLTFTTFWLGAMMRPVGAIFLGAYLDNIGRRKGLIVTLAIMAMGTIVTSTPPRKGGVGGWVLRLAPLPSGRGRGGFVFLPLPFREGGRGG